MRLLEVVGITRMFGGLSALSDVTFEVESGGIHGLIGPNGAGKTTLLNILSGQIRPTFGQVRYTGRMIHSLPAHRVAALGIARTFQSIRLFPSMTCLENIVVGQHLTAARPLLPRLLQLPYTRRQERQYRDLALETLARVGLEHRMDLQARSLSYGERRRLEIARALASRPRLLLLDEPVAGMRRAGTARIAELIRLLAKEGMTVLLIEHNMSFVMELCSRVTVLNFGRVITTSSPEEVSAHPGVIEAYLGVEESDA
jgi:ABC-type branched-subunit amino acid transport system ATPase component